MSYNRQDKKFNITINNKRTSIKLTLRLYELFLLIEDIEESEVREKLERELRKKK